MTPKVADIVDSLIQTIRAEMIASFSEALKEARPSPVRRLAPVARAQSKPAQQARRSPLELEKLINSVRAHITKHPGQRTVEISKAMGIPTGELKLPIKKLKADKVLSQKGEKSQARYSVK